MVTLACSPDSIDLPNPVFGDTHYVDTGAIVRRTQGMELKTMKAATWPVVQRLSVTFRNLSSSDIGDLLGFMIDHIGAEVTFTDQRGVVWTGIIITPTNSAVHEGKDSNCGRRNFSFELEGTSA